MVAAYLFARINPETGVCEGFSLLSTRHPTQKIGPRAPVLALVAEQQGEDLAAAEAALMKFVEALPNLKALWEKFGQKPGPRT